MSKIYSVKNIDLSRMLHWREGNSWLVGNRDFDVLAQGPTLEKANSRWIKQFALSILVNDGNNIMKPPQKEVLNDWVAKHEAFNLQSCN